MWKSHKSFKDYLKSLDPSSILAERILCEDGLGKYKDFTTKSRQWMIHVMNDQLLNKGYNFAVYKQ